MMFMVKILFVISFLLFAFGCQPAKKFTVYEDYKEKYEWDREKGYTKNPEASWGVRWET